MLVIFLAAAVSSRNNKAVSLTTSPWLQELSGA